MSSVSRQKRISQHLFSALEIQDGGAEAKDRGHAAARQNAWYFECAWEVAHKVGGIYTVIRSKAGESSALLLVGYVTVRLFFEFVSDRSVKGALLCC